MPPPAPRDQGNRYIDGSRIPLGYQQITTLNTVQPLTVPVGTRFVILRPESQGIRWRDDGTAPTASVGMPLASGETFMYTGDPTTLQFIEQTASAKLNVSYYG